MESPVALPAKVPEAVSKPVLACLDSDPASRPTPRELAGMLEPLVGALPKPQLGGFRPRW